METLSFCFPSEFKYLDRVYDITSKILEEVPINLRGKKEILLAVTEAVTNSLVHGNKRNPTKTVELTFLHDNGYLEVRIDDQGKGFRPQDVDLKKSADALVEDGRGIPIMKACMDKVEFRFIKCRGMRVILRKNLLS